MARGAIGGNPLLKFISARRGGLVTHAWSVSVEPPWEVHVNEGAFLDDSGTGSWFEAWASSGLAAGYRID